MQPAADAITDKRPDAKADAYWAGRALRPGVQAFATDVCVPISRLKRALDPHNILNPGKIVALG